MAARNKKFIKFRHKFYYWFCRPGGFIMELLCGFKSRVFRIRKGEQYIILANHQSQLDPIYLAMGFNKPVYMLATDNLFSNSFSSKMLVHCFSPIRKLKANAMDVACMRTVHQVVKEGGNIGIFAEGNRAWADFQFNIAPAIAKLVKGLKIPIAFYNFHGGYGVDPRWGGKRRKGRYTGSVSQVLSVEEISSMSNGELYERIVSGIRVIDSDSGEKYISDERAEYLERAVYVCPVCGSVHTLKSEGNYITCSNCHTAVEYTEDLKLRSDNPDFPFTSLASWWEFQQKWTLNYEIKPGEIIFTDENVSLFDKTTNEHIEIATGTLSLSDTELKVGDYSIPTSEIETFTVYGKGRILLGCGEKSYYVEGELRFNPIKYVFMLNRVTSSEREDFYYGLHTNDNLLR